MPITYSHNDSILVKQYPILAFMGNDIKTGRHVLFFSDSIGVCVKDSEEDIRNKKSYLMTVQTNYNVNDPNYWTKIAKGKVVIRTGDTIKKVE